MEPEDRELLSRALDVLGDQNARDAQDQHAERVALVKTLRPAKPDSLRPPKPDHGPIAERIARAEAVITYAESVARARVAAVEKWATSSPLAGAA